MVKQSQKIQLPIRANRETLVISSHVDPFCKQACCESANVKNIGFKTHRGSSIDFDYDSDEVKVMMTRDGHGLVFLGHLLGQLQIPLDNVDIMGPNSDIENLKFQNWGTVISIGSELSNPATRRILVNELRDVDPDRIEFQFSELTSTPNDKIVYRLRGNTVSEVSLLSEEDVAAIVYFQKMFSEGSIVNFFVLAGLGPQGTLAACYKFAREFKQLLSLHDNLPFFRILKTRRGQLDLKVDLGEGGPIQLDSQLKMKYRQAQARKRFAVALSFPDEHRSYVQAVAEILATTLTRARVFYDHFHEEELAKPNKDLAMQKSIHEDSELVVVFLCKEYEEEKWCGLAHRAIRDMISQGRDNEILFVRIAEGDVSGVFGIDGSVDAENKEPSYIAPLICQRLERLRSQNS